MLGGTGEAGVLLGGGEVTTGARDGGEERREVTEERGEEGGIEGIFIR